MKLTQIEYFIAVCECGSFSRAAEKCHISQPGISKAIRELEEECGVALFQRNRNNIQITRRGRILLEHARQFQNTPGSSRTTTGICARWSVPWAPERP